MLIGGRIRIELDEAIQNVDKLILVLSKDSIRSDWVEQEVECAFEMERASAKTILMPIRIDESVMKSRQGWAAHLRRTRNIAAFTTRYRDWGYLSAFTRLVHDLKTEFDDR
jgi:hypothetical protein